MSSEISILAAGQPEAPTAPTTSVVANYVIVDWTAPFDNHMPITGYRILIGQQDGSYYTEDQIGCDGSSDAIRQATQCTIMLDTLTAPPWGLVQGASIYAKIIAYNALGDGPESPVGNGGVVVLVPDAPINV